MSLTCYEIEPELDPVVSEFKAIKILDVKEETPPPLKINEVKGLYMVYVQIEEKTHIINICVARPIGFEQLLNHVKDTLKTSTLPCFTKIAYHKFD